MALYSYCIPIDDGAAPNPYGGICSLVICKPVIRRLAQPGDWIVGTGSKNAPGGYDLSRHLVYAMKVTQTMSMQEYDSHCQKQLRIKLPNIQSKDYRRLVGDCIFNFSQNPTEPAVRPSVHSMLHREHDLSGQKALLSNHFYYFGSNPVPLQAEFFPIIKSGQGHRSTSTEPYAIAFLEWLESAYGRLLNIPQAEPQIKVQFETDPTGTTCVTARCQVTEEETEDKDVQLAPQVNCHG